MKKRTLILVLFVIIKVEAQTSTFTTVDSLFAKGRYQLALAVLEDFPSESFETNYKKAMIYQSIDNYKKTVFFLEKALDFKEDYQTELKLAKMYQKLQRTHKSIKIYENLLAKDSLNLVLAYQLGKLYLTAKKSKNAINLFKYLIKEDSQNANYSYRLALGYRQLKKRNAMINSFLDAYAKDSTHIKAVAHLAVSFQNLQDKDSTQLFVDKGLHINKNHINLNKLKINQLYRDKKYSETIPLLLNLDSIDRKEDTYSISMLGRSFYHLDSLKKAKIYFKKLWRIERENYKALTYLGHINMQEKNYKRAGMNYKAATKIGKEKRDEEYFGLATMYLETDHPKKAIFNFEKAYEENYKNYKALYQLAKVSDDYYKDKKIAYKHYKTYLDYFLENDNEITAFVAKRVKEIEKEYFMKGVTLK